MATPPAPPILFLIFNRPDLTERVFQRIRETRPRQLFIAADGPRTDHLGEDQLCAETRAVVATIDWACEVHRLYREQNLGCKNAVSEAITWFFEHVEEGIIIEDDCLPEPSFFSYCALLLEKYRYEDQVYVIGGTNVASNRLTGNSYRFTKVPEIWGWASWRRAWAGYDPDMIDWDSLRETGWLKRIWKHTYIANYWTSVFTRARSGEIDSWAYPFFFHIWSRNGVATIPDVNLISNVGFGERATHTTTTTSPLSKIATGRIVAPISHPTNTYIDDKLDHRLHRARFRARRPSEMRIRKMRSYVQRMRRTFTKDTRLFWRRSRRAIWRLTRNL